MGIRLFNEPSRIVKNELDAYLWKVGQGFKMSRKAKTMLGIKDDTIHNLAVGTTEDNRCLIIKAVDTKEEGNCSINKQSVISSKKVVTALESFGDKFKITFDKTEEGFFFMVIENQVIENTSVEENVEEEITEDVEEHF